jgi:hypothetical protein
MRLILSISIFLLASNLFAQTFFPCKVDSAKWSGHQLSLNGTFDYSATSLPFTFVSKFLFGGAIDEQLKNDVFDRHNGNNRFGLEAYTELQYSNFNVKLFGDERFGMLFQLGMQNFNQIHYSNDAFKLAFFGNQSFGTEEAKLDQSFLNTSTFSKIGWGLLDKKTHSFLAINLVQLQNLGQVQVNSGRLLLTPDEDSLNFLYDGSAVFANNNNFIKGLGLSVDFNIIFRANADDSSRFNVPFQFSGRNLGWVHSLGTWEKYEAKNFFPFDGFALSEAISASNSLINTDNILDTLNVEKTPVQKGYFLPGTLQIAKIVDINSPKLFQTFFGLRAYLVRNVLPYTFIGGDYKAAKNFHLGAHVGFGGFTYFRGGLYANYQTNNINIGLAAENLYLKNGLCTSIRLQWAF